MIHLDYSIYAGIKLENPQEVITKPYPENKRWSPPVTDDPR